MKKLALTLLVSLSTCLSGSGCGPHPKLDRAEQIFIDCAKTDISQAVKDPAAVMKSVLETVVSIFISGDSSWEGELEAVGKQVGSDTLACAVKAAQSLFTAHADGSPLTAASPAAVRATAFLHAHPEWKFSAE